MFCLKYNCAVCLEDGISTRSMKEYERSLIAVEAVDEEFDACFV